jgi:hypothetical protein
VQTAVDRLDLTASVIEQGANEEGTLTLQYTRSFGSHQLAFATPLVDTALGGGLNLNAGDLVLEYAWTPRKKISAGPWVPTDYGTGIQLSIPTGSVANGTGSGSVILAPRLGGVFHVGPGWAIAPSIEYQYAFEYEENSQRTRGIAAASQFVYIGPNGFWVNLTPVYIQDLNNQQGAFGAGVIAGKLLSSHFAISIQYLREPVYGDPELGKGFNYANIWQLVFHFPLHYKQ